MVRWLLRSCLLVVPGLALLPAVEARLELPDPLVPGVTMAARLVITDPPDKGAKLVLPKVPGLAWEVQPGGVQRIAIVDGRRSSSQEVILAVQAAEAGEYPIPSLLVRFKDGSSATTAATVLRCRPADPGLVGEAVATVAFEPALIVPGEPTSLVYRVHLRVGELRTLGIEPPQGAILLGDRSQSESRTIDGQGRQWLVLTTTWPMTMANPGSYQVTGQQPYLIGDIFRQVQRQVPVKPASLTVTPLPSEGRPDDFCGLIGPISVGASLDPPRIALGEGSQYELSVTGRQVGLLRPPPLQLPDGLQAWPKEGDGKEEQGRRRFRWDLVPSATGDFNLPPISVPYFDPQSRSYRRAEGPALRLQVVPGRNRSLVIAGATAPAPLAPAAAAPVAISLPEPLRGAVPRRFPPLLTLLGAGCGLGLGLACGLALHLASRRPHRGRKLAGAWRRRDLAACAAALRTWEEQELPPGPRTARQQLLDAVEGARFGAALPVEAETWARLLAGER